MSGPKSGYYEVVSAAEQQRRQLAAARDRYERARAAARELQGAISSAAATYGDLGVRVPLKAAAAGASAADVDRAAESLRAAMAEAQRKLDAAVGRARLRLLAADGVIVSAVLKPEPGRGVPEAGRGAPEQRRAAERPADDDAIGRVLARLPADAPAEVAARCASLARAYADAASGPAKERSLDGIRYIVQAEQDRQARIRRNGTLLEELYRELDGLSSAEVETVRGMLKGVDPAGELPEGLRDRVAAARAAAERERDREFALAAAGKALSDLGYAVGDDFRTAVPSAGALVELPHGGNYAVQIRERGQQLLFNVVRFDEDGPGDAAQDSHAEEAFCRDFDRFGARLRAEGVHLAMQRADAPGQTPMQVVAGSRRARRPASRAATARARERRP